MMKRALAAAAALMFAATLAFAAPVTGKVSSVEGKKVQVTVSGELATWMKKGATVKWKAGVGRIIDVKDKVLTINTKGATDLKAGDELALDKGPADLSGC
jgi:hypothetical protein